MQDNDMLGHAKVVRYPGRPDDQAGVVMPKRICGNLFQGWGPKLLAAALAIGALAVSEKPVLAQSVAQAACADRGATLISSPSFSRPEGAMAGGVTLLRINLSASGQIEHVAVSQSSGDPVLDIEAIRIARASRYNPAMANCRAAAETFLYRVEF
jgi:TonB family protein